MVTRGYSWKFLLKSNFSHYNYFNAWKSIKFSILFTLFFVSMRFDKGENKKSCPTRHIARCQGTVKLDTKCHALKITKSPYCCGATVGSEQQHNQDLREIYKGQRILEFITFYHNALHLTRVHRATNNSNKNTGKFGG